MKKYFITILYAIFFATSVLAYGDNLWEHFKGRLPSLEERKILYEQEIDFDEYKGTKEQNLKLHRYFDNDLNLPLGTLAFPPSTVEGTSTAGWTDDGSNVRLNTSSDFVGIGTTQPLQKLSVVGGNFYLGGDIAFMSGNINLSGGTINFGGTGGTSTLTSKNGLLGIGTTTPAKTFSVQGDAFVSGTTTVGVLKATSTIETVLLKATGTTTLNGVNLQWPSTDGDASQVIQTDGSGVLSYVTAAAQRSTLLLATTTSSTVNDNTTEQTAFTYSLAGGSLSTGNAVRIKGIIKSWNLDHSTTGSSQNTTIRFKYGATTIWETVFISVSSASVNALQGYFEYVLIANGATNIQSSSNVIYAAQGVTTPITNSYIINVANANGSASIDSTVAQTIVITGQVSVDDADNNGFTIDEIVVELLK